MGLYRDEAGLIFEADDRFASSMGYDPVSAAEEQDIYAQRGLEQRADDRGALGTINAAATGVAGGLTLGGSDWLLGQVLTDGERETLQGDIEAHPYARMAGELTGAIAPALVAPGTALARTPSGYLSSIASREAAEGLARGGVAGYGKALGAMGAEGAAQGVGQYIGHSALADTDVTVEGLSGAVGTGFAFGAAGGGAVLGVAKGTIAARKLYSRVMDGDKAAKAAESSWSVAMQEALDSDAMTAGVAKARLEEINAAKVEAQKYRQQARYTTGEEQIRARSYEAPPAYKPGAPELMRTADGTQIIPRPRFDDVPVAAPAIDDIARPGPHTQVQPGFRRTDLPEGAGPDYSVPDRIGSAPRAVDPYAPDIVGEGALLSGMVKHDVANQARTGIPGMLDELAEYQRATGTGPAVAPSLEGQLAQMQKRVTAGETLAEMRLAKTEDLLGKAIAKEEAALVDAIDEFDVAHKGFMRVRDDAPWGGKDSPMPPSDEVIPVIDVYGIDGQPSAAARANAGRPSAKSLAILDNAHEEALLRARSSSDPREVGAALDEAQQLEGMLERLTGPSSLQAPGKVGGGVLSWVDDIPKRVKDIERYERASAKLAEVVGDQAHPVSVARAKGVADADREMMRKVNDRSARAVDDAETFGPHEFVGPQSKTPHERITYAKERELDAQKALDTVTHEANAARKASTEADKVVRTGESAKKKALAADAKLNRVTASGASKAASAGGVLELMDIPGLPKPSDLPFVGPLIGAFLKFHILKKAMGRAAGRIPATADSRVAALAARTKDRVARAIDRSLGVMEKGAKYSSRIAPSAAGILSSRIYDDGQDSPKKGAPITELAAARIRELGVYVTTPGAIENDVRRELREVTDPDIIAAAEKHRRMMMEYLLNSAPKMPEQGLLQKSKWQPSPAAAMSFARRVEAVSDPAGVLERLSHVQDMISLEAAEALREVYPQLFSLAQQRVMEKAAEAKGNIPYRQRVQMQLLYQIPLDHALSPGSLKITQSVYERKPMVPPGAMPAPPTPSVAGETNLTALFQSQADRNALR